MNIPSSLLGPVPQDELSEVDIYYFEPEVYDFVYSTLKKHKVRIWKQGVPDGSLKFTYPIPTDLLLVDDLNCLQNGPMDNKMNHFVSMTLFQLALIYSGHYEKIEELRENWAYYGIIEKNLYYIIPNFLRQGRFNQPLKDAVKNSATSLKNTMEAFNLILMNRNIDVLGEQKYENIVNRIGQDIGQKAEVLVNAIDNPPSNKNILGPNYVPSDDILNDLTAVEPWRNQIYESGKERLLDVNRIPKGFIYSDLMDIYVTRKLVIATPEEQNLMWEDNNLLQAVWWATLGALDSTGLSLPNVGKQLNIPPNIFEQRRRHQLNTLSVLLQSNPEYVTPNVAATILEVDDDIARKILSTFSAKRTTE